MRKAVIKSTNMCNEVMFYLALTVYAILECTTNSEAQQQVYTQTPAKQMIFHRGQVQLNWTTSIPDDAILWCYWKFYSAGAWDEFLGYNNNLKNRMNISSWHKGWDYTNPALPCFGGIQRSEVDRQFDGRYKMVLGLHNTTEFESPEAIVSIIACFKPEGYDRLSNPQLFIEDGIPKLIYACNNYVRLLKCNSSDSKWTGQIDECESVPSTDAHYTRREKAMIAFIVIIVMLIAAAFIWYFLFKKRSQYSCSDDDEKQSLISLAFTQTFGEHDDVITMKQGTRLILSVTLNKTAAVYWSINHVDLNPRTDSDVTFSNKNRTHKMIINQGATSMSGILKCLAKTGDGEQITHTKGLVVISDTASKPVFLMDTDEIIAKKVGDELRIQTFVYGKPKPNINWYKGGQMQNSDNIIIVENNCGYNDVCMTIKKLILQDMGEIKIVASNDVGEDEITTLLDIRGAPRFTSTCEDASVVRGEILTLTTTIEAYPLPHDIIWLIDGFRCQGSKIEEENTSTVRASLSHRTNDLTIGSHSVQLTATNYEGSCSHDCNFEIRTPVSLDFIKRLTDISVEYGKDAKWQVSVIGDPLPELTFFRNGLIIKSTSHTEINEKKYNSKKKLEVDIFIRNCMVDDGGMYEVKAENKIGENISTLGKLTVNGTAPFFTKAPEHMYLYKGDNKDMVVEASGKPSPTITWQFETPYHEGLSTSGYESKSKLSLKNAQCWHTGRISVEANNAFDKDSRSFVIKVFGWYNFDSSFILSTHISLSLFSFREKGNCYYTATVRPDHHGRPRCNIQMCLQCNP